MSMMTTEECRAAEEAELRDLVSQEVEVGGDDDRRYIKYMAIGVKVGDDWNYLPRRVEGRTWGLDWVAKTVAYEHGVWALEVDVKGAD